jgi:hypothetical protein
MQQKCVPEALRAVWALFKFHLSKWDEAYEQMFFVGSSFNLIFEK